MAIKDAPTVNILQFDENEAYDQDRPISSLIRTQLLHLHAAEYIQVPPKHRTNVNINDLHTEHEASKYIQKVTALLHKFGKAGKAGKSGASKRPARKKARTSGRKVASKSRKTKSGAKKRAPRK